MLTAFRELPSQRLARTLLVVLNKRSYTVRTQRMHRQLAVAVSVPFFCPGVDRQAPNRSYVAEQAMGIDTKVDRSKDIGEWLEAQATPSCDETVTSASSLSEPDFDLDPTFCTIIGNSSQGCAVDWFYCPEAYDETLLVETMQSSCSNSTTCSDQWNCQVQREDLNVDWLYSASAYCQSKPQPVEPYVALSPRSTGLP